MWIVGLKTRMIIAFLSFYSQWLFGALSWVLAGSRSITGSNTSSI
jgi:hypothetical protein